MLFTTNNMLYSVKITKSNNIAGILKKENIPENVVFYFSPNFCVYHDERA